MRANLEKTESGTGSTGSGTGSGTGTCRERREPDNRRRRDGLEEYQAALVLNAADIATDNTTVTLKAVPDDISHGSAKYSYAASSARLPGRSPGQRTEAIPSPALRIRGRTIS